MATEKSMSDEDRALLLETVRALVAAKIAPNAKVIDEDSRISSEMFRSLADAGINAATVPEIFGGGGASVLDGAMLIEEVAKGSGAVASILSMNLAGVEAVAASANGHLKYDLLPKVSGGERVLVWSADPDGSRGGVIASAATGGTLLNGSLHWVPCYDSGADLVVLVDAVVDSQRQLLAVDVSKPSGGRVEIGPLESDLGLRGASPRSLVFHDVLVSTGQIVAAGASGVAAAEKFYSAARVALASQANGIAVSALYHATNYAAERSQFGVPIMDFESTRTILGTMALNIEAARKLTFAAAEQIDAGGQSYERFPLDLGAKWLATKVAVEVAIDAVQVHGGYGFVKDYPVERLMRDAKMTQLMLGTGQILAIADALANAD